MRLSLRSRLILAAICLTGTLFVAKGIRSPLATAQPAVVESLDRTTLPIPEPTIPHSTVLDARNAKAPPRFAVKAPAKAPNVLVILIDDMGFGQSSAFGGPIHMPTLERLAKNGLRYNKFHTTALCSPTRAAAAQRSQSSHVQHGIDHRNGHRVSRADRTTPQ